VLLEMGEDGAERRERGRRMEEEGLLTAAATRRNEEEPLLPLQLAPAALEARQAAVAMMWKSKRSGKKAGGRKREEGRR
jgi:hypothetical protein